MIPIFNLNETKIQEHGESLGFSVGKIKAISNHVQSSQNAIRKTYERIEDKIMDNSVNGGGEGDQTVEGIVLQRSKKLVEKLGKIWQTDFKSAKEIAEKITEKKPTKSATANRPADKSNVFKKPVVTICSSYEEKTILEKIFENQGIKADIRVEDKVTIEVSKTSELKRITVETQTDSFKIEVDPFRHPDGPSVQSVGFQPFNKTGTSPVPVPVPDPVLKHVSSSNNFSNIDQVESVKVESVKVETVEIKQKNDDTAKNLIMSALYPKRPVPTTIKNQPLVGHVVHYDLNPPVNLRPAENPVKTFPDIKLDQRTEAYNELRNFAENPKSLECTQICSSIFDGKPCPHGDRCRFAHNNEQWNSRVCKFGNNCRYQKCFNNCRHSVQNPNGEIIEESRVDFLSRKNLSPEKINEFMGAAIFEVQPTKKSVNLFNSTPAPWRLKISNID